MDPLTLLRRQYYALCPAYLLQLPPSLVLASEQGHATLLSLLDDDPPRPEDGYARQFWKRVLPVLERGVMSGEGVEEVDERIYQAVAELAVGAVDTGAPAQSFKTFLYSPSTLHAPDPRPRAPVEATLAPQDGGRLSTDSTVNDAPASRVETRSSASGSNDRSAGDGERLRVTSAPGSNTAPSATSSSPTPEHRITLLEEQVAVSSGSTGLRTWTASLHLGHHFLTGGVRLASQVLELGAGTGFLSILLTQLGYDVIATDLGDDGAECPYDTGARQTPLGRLRANLALNGIAESKAQALDWADAAAAADERPPVWDDAKGRDIVAADVIYDPDIVPLLVAALSALITRQGVLAATVRNEDTFALFLERCASAGLKTELLPLEPMDRASPTFWDTALDLGARVEVVRIIRSP